MGDELRGENLVHLSVRFSTETELKQFQDLLLKKLWRIGIHDKRVLKIVSQMLKAGYIDQDLYHATEMGTPQGGILSPLLSNVYLNDFDWYVGRCYMCRIVNANINAMIPGGSNGQASRPSIISVMRTIG